LHACAYPHPNFHSPGIKDTDLLHPLPALSHASMLHKAHLSQSGSMKMDATASSVRQFRSNAFTSFLVRSASSPGPPLLSHTASNVTRTHPTTTKMTVPCGRFAAGVLPLITHTMTAPLHIMGAS
jgi:hypothetical protein